MIQSLHCWNSGGVRDTPQAPPPTHAGASIPPASPLRPALGPCEAGALLYFPIHYSGTTAFEGSAASVAEPLSRCYDESLETRGQVRRAGSIATRRAGKNGWDLGPAQVMFLWDLDVDKA